MLIIGGMFSIPFCTLPEALHTILGICRNGCTREKDMKIPIEQKRCVKFISKPTRNTRILYFEACSVALQLHIRNRFWRLFCGELFDTLLFGAMADEELAVLLGEDAVVESLNNYSFGGFHVDNIIG